MCNPFQSAPEGGYRVTLYVYPDSYVLTFAKNNNIPYEIISDDVHLHEYVSTETKGTCTENGFTTYTCSICGDSYTSNYVYAYGHDMDFGVVTKEPTPESGGEKTYTCIICGFTQIEHLHFYVEEVIPPSCDQNGYTEHKCSCGDRYTSDYTYSIGHAYEIHEIVAPTCSEEGYTIYSCICGDYYYADEVPALDHTFGDWQVTRKPQVGMTGIKVRSCTVCGFSHAEELPALSESFTDVADGDWFQNAVAWAASNGVTTGTSSTTSTTFSPQDPCTRGQIVTFLWRAAGSPEPASSSNPFKDVVSTDYFYKAVLWAVEKGITTGTGADTFYPNTGCTRAQVATFLWRSQGKPAATSKNPFVDVKQGEYYYDAVIWAVENGVTTGTSPTTFAPNDTCTRGQIVTFLYRAIA